MDIIVWFVVGFVVAVFALGACFWVLRSMWTSNVMSVRGQQSVAAREELEGELLLAIEEALSLHKGGKSLEDAGLEAMSKHPRVALKYGAKLKKMIQKLAGE